MRHLFEPVIDDNWDNLINDLQGDIITDSYNRLLLTDFEYQTISNLGDEQQMVINFLNVMKNKSDEQLKVFIECLNEYYPWLRAGLYESMSQLNRRDPLFKMKKLGGIPNLPQRIIERTGLLNQLKNGLKKLKKGGYLVLHGMLGCGKTTLAALALDDEGLVTNYFQETVYWITVGKVGEDDLGFLQQQLNERFPEPIQLSPISHLATIQLTKMIEKECNDCLIVLDDVKNKSVLECLAVGAKFLVITEDKDVIGHKLKSHVDCIKVDEGFTHHETLELFSKSLNVKGNLLPKQASDIHGYTKGHPLTISLIASHLENFKDGVLNDDNSRWDYYTRKLFRKKDRRSLNVSQIFHNAMQDSVLSLGTEYEDFFRQLSVFVDDVNIKPEVLGILWNLEKHQAEDIMMDFVRKSLAVTKWNEVQKSYVYGVHVLVSNFLKEILSDADEKELHQKLINRYSNNCKGVWSELPKNDNYIFYYIGYHLKKAGNSDLLRSLYFDLPFLEAKLQVCGPADLIRDFKTYKDFITNKELELEQKVDEFRTFVEYHGVSIAQGIDIIQAALQEPTSSKVHLAAVQLAKKKKSKQSYLHCFPLSQVDKIILPETMEINEEITIVCFGTSVYEVIVASGPSRKNLKLYNIRTKGVLKEFKGHTGEIRHLDISSCKPQFLSASFDNTIRVWSLENGESCLGDRSPSPREIQSDYVNLFNTNQTDKDKSLFILNHDYPLLWGVFSKKHASLIASLGMNGSISVWDYDVKKWEVKHPHVSGLKCLDFFDNENFIAAGGNDKIILCYAETGTLFEKPKEFKEFISLRSLPGSLGGGLVVLTSHSLSCYPSNNNEINTHNIPLPEGLLLKQLHSVGTHIATTTESGELYVFHFLNGSIVAHFPTMPRQVSSICVNDRAILSGYSDGSLNLYPLEGLPSPLTSVKWKLGNEPVLVKIDHSQENIEVVIGKEKCIIAERNTRIKLADVSSSGKIIVMACEGGQVTYKDMGQECDEILINHHEEILPTKLYLLENDLEKIVVALYENEEALIWKVKERKLVKLNGKRSVSCQFANLLQLKDLTCLITAFPLTIWTLNGDPMGDCGMFVTHPNVNTYCVSPDFRTLVYAGEKMWLSKYNGGVFEFEIDTIKLLSFSPSSKILALFNGRGFLIILDCKTMKKVLLKEIREPTTCLAVSDSGCVCYGGSNHLSIVAKRNEQILSSKIVLDTRSVAAKHDEDKFAVADNAGVLYIVYLDIINGGDILPNK